MRIEETGALIWEKSGYFLRRASGGRIKLDLRRIAYADEPVQVRIVGTYVSEDLVDVSELRAF